MKAMSASLRSLHKAGPCICFAIFYGNADDETMTVKWVSKLLIAQLVCAGTVAANNSVDKVMFCQCHLRFVLGVQAGHKGAKIMVFSTWVTLIAHGTVLVHVHGKICNTQVLLSGTFVDVGMHRVMCTRALDNVALYR